MEPARNRGFSMIELTFVILILGLAFAASIPAYNTFRKTHDLKGATQNVASQLRLMREKAIATGIPQEIHFTYNYVACGGCDYHIHNSGVIEAKWELPNGVSYYYGTGTQWQFRMTKAGRSLDSGMIVLQNDRGLRDTVLVQASGLVLVN